MRGLIIEWMLMANLLLIIISCNGAKGQPNMNSTNITNDKREPRLSCLPVCYGAKCNQRTCGCKVYKKKDCPWGFVKSACECCDVCAKGYGETCGGMWDLKGKCGKGLQCAHSKTTQDHFGSASGICAPKNYCACGPRWGFLIGKNGIV